MYQLVEMIVIDVSKDSEHLSGNIFAIFHEVRRERATCFRGEDRLIIDLVGDPSQDVFNVLACREVNGLARIVFPEIIRVWACVHGGILLRCHILRNDAVKLVQVAV